MAEVSGRALKATLEACERIGLDLEASLAAAGLARSAAEIGCNWDPFARFLAEIRRQHGERALEEIGTTLADTPSWRFVRRLTRWVVGPQQALWLADRLIGPANFPILQHGLTRPTPRRFELWLAIPDRFARSPEYFRIAHAHLCHAMALLDAPPLALEMDPDGQSARIVLELSRPTSGQVPSWARHLLAEATDRLRLGGDRRALAESHADLRRSRRDFRSVLDRLPDGVAILRGGRLRYANPACLELLEASSFDAVRGRDMIALLGPREVTRTLLALADGQEVEIRVPRQGGDRLVQILPPTPIRFQDEDCNLVVVRDLTEHRRLQEKLVLADRMASLGTLAAGVAHEINNPLASLHLSLEFLARRIDAAAEREGRIEDVDEVRKAVQDALEGSRRVGTIVRDLKLFSHPAPDPVEAVELNDLVRRTLSLARRTLTTRAKLVEAYAPDEIEVPANSARLAQVVLNLVLNAVQAIPEARAGQGTVIVRTRLEGETAVLEVEDDGEGIDPKLKPHLFDPFFTTKPQGQGTGLGLSICHGIVERLGGRIALESTPGVGTRVVVTVPGARTRVAREQDLGSGDGSPWPAG